MTTEQLTTDAGPITEMIVEDVIAGRHDAAALALAACKPDYVDAFLAYSMSRFGVVVWRRLRSEVSRVRGDR